MISVTEKAATQIKEIADAEGITYYVVRVKVVGGGCAGFTHDMTYDNNISELDEVIVCNDDVKVIVDPLSLQYLEDSTIDYIDSPMGGGFKFLNPNVKGSCGCGSSVSF
jgi:iron-sulfur cluster insertion protein